MNNNNNNNNSTTVSATDGMQVNSSTFDEPDRAVAPTAATAMKISSPPLDDNENFASSAAIISNSKNSNNSSNNKKEMDSGNSDNKVPNNYNGNNNISVNMNSRTILDEEESDSRRSTSPQKMNWVKFDDDDNAVLQSAAAAAAASISNTASSGTLDDDHSSVSTNTTVGSVIAPPPSKLSAASSMKSSSSSSPVPPLLNNMLATAESVSNVSSSGVKFSSSLSSSSSPPLSESSARSISSNSGPNKTAIPAVSSIISQQSAQHMSSSSSGVDVAPAVLATESVHVNLNNSLSSPQKPNQSIPGGSTLSSNNEQLKSNVPKQVSIPMSTPAPMRTIELSTGRVREGFANGDLIVTLLPTNAKWPWVIPAIFRPELVPEELMAQGLTLTVEEYVNAMETLVNDYRFTVYNICYKRVLVAWILFAFCVLLTLLFSGLQGIALFSLGVGWLFLNAAAIFLCMWVKLRLARGLEKCLARVNKQLVRHKILLVLDDRGRLSCHKVNLCFLYFDSAQCVSHLNEFLERCEQNGTNIQAGWEAKLDIDVGDIVIQGNNPVRLSRKQAIAQEIFLSYLQRWGKDFLRRRLDWTVNADGVHETPRHLMSSICPCQYIEEILNNKIQMQNKTCCFGLKNPFREFC